MPVDLSIKRVPDALAHKLRKRAARHHRSLQRELMTILEAALQESPAAIKASAVRERPAPYRTRTPRVIAPQSESALTIRQARDERTITLADLHARLSAAGAGTPSESTGWIRQLRGDR